MKNDSMKKLILVGVVAVAAIAGVMFLLKDRFSGMGPFMRLTRSAGDLMVMNDLSDTVSVEYKEGDKDVALTVQPGQQVSGGQGLIRIFTARKAGSYELTYAFPRPASSIQDVAVSQVIAAAKQDKMEGEIYTKRGMIGDVEVFYEEVKQ
jgi:hypothetical protein